MTRRDRAACALALELLRADDIGAACDALWLGGDDLARLALMLDDLTRQHRDTGILRARLALYLRALLRADRGDFGPLYCAGCGQPWDARDEQIPTWCFYEAVGRAHLARPFARATRPLWEQAPPTRPR